MRHLPLVVYHLAGSVSLASTVAGFCLMASFRPDRAATPSPLLDPLAWHPILQWGAVLFVGGGIAFLLMLRMPPPSTGGEKEGSQTAG